MRATLLSAAVVLLLTAGCAPRESARPQRAPEAAAPRRVPLVSLAPSRMPLETELLSTEIPAVGGDGFFDFFILDYSDMPIADEGLFVDVPAMTGAVIFSLPGMAVGGVLMLVIWPFDDHMGETAMWMPYVISRDFAYLGNVVVGGPFWLVKKTVWDGPKAFGRFVNLHVRSRKGQVDYLVKKRCSLEPWTSPNRHARTIEEIEAKLLELTGRETAPFEGWNIWWTRHRGDFDGKMRPAAPAPAG